MITSLEWVFLLTILSLLPARVNQLLKKLIPLSQGNLFLMIGSLKATHKLIFNIHSGIQIRSIISIRLR